MVNRNGNSRVRNTASQSSRYGNGAGTRQRQAASSYTLYDAFDVSAYGKQNKQGSGSVGSTRKGSNSYGASNGSDSSYSRRVSQGDYTKQRKKRKRKKVAAISLAVILILCLSGVGAAFAYYNNVASNFKEGLPSDLNDALVPAQNIETDPFYILLLGTDGSTERDATSEYAGGNYRSDSMILARIDPGTNKVTLVSLHRDSFVNIEGYGENKLNAAYALGGATLAVKTVSELAGVDISHYAEINFDGFKDIVDALGGVEVNVPMEIDDSRAGGYVAEGKQTLNGDQALILCRARHAYDDYGDGDVYRAANQRLVISAIAKKILQSDVTTMASTVTAMSEYISTDLEIMDIVGLAQAMQGLDPDNDLYSAMAPTTSTYINETWYEYITLDAWKTMMERVDQGLPPTESDVVDESSGTVLATIGDGEVDTSTGTSTTSEYRTGTVIVRNGNGTDGVAKDAGAKLEKVGYTVETGNANDFDYAQTIVVYSSTSQANEAKEIANTIGVGKAQVNDGTYDFDGDFLVVIGADWTD